MSNNPYTSSFKGYISAAAVVLATSSSGYASNDINTSYSSYTSENVISKNNNFSGEIKINNTKDVYELTSNEIINKIEKELKITIDNKFIPNKTESNITLFITCKEFRDLCETENYQEAYDLEMKIKLSVVDELEKSTIIDRIAFL